MVRLISPVSSALPSSFTKLRPHTEPQPDLLLHKLFPKPGISSFRAETSKEKKPRRVAEASREGS